VKLITSLGTGVYKTTRYQWGDRECETSLFPEALVCWLEPKTTVVLLTEVAQQHDNWKQLQQVLDGKTTLQPVRIPEGRSEQELWQIFDAVQSNVDDVEEVVIDITHAFRSLPLIFFVVTAFLRAVRDVKVKHILYGCFVAENQPSPVLDLTLMVELLDWMEGVRRFKKLGDAEFIGQALIDTQASLYHQSTQDVKPKHLKTVGQAMRDLSSEMRSLRVWQMMKTADRLLTEIKPAEAEAQKWSKPFALLIEQIRQQVEPIAHSQPDTLDEQNLRKQIAMMRFMLERGQILQALLLQREWLVNFALWKVGQKEWLKREVREPVERGLGEVAQAWLRNREVATGKLAESVDSKTLSLLAELWNRIQDLRNDPAHCGMRENAADYRKLHDSVEGFLRQLEALL